MYREKKLQSYWLLTALLIVSCGLLSWPAFAGPGNNSAISQDGHMTPKIGDEGNDPLQFVEDELVVKLNGLDSISIDEINIMFGTQVRNWLPQLEIFLLTTEEGADVESLAAEIEALSMVLFAHPNYIVDPLQPVQGSFPFSDDDFSGSFSDQRAANALNLAEAHEIATGVGVSVAVIDGGVDYNHPAFDGTVVSGYDYVDDDPDAFDEPGGDNSGHGTFVAGVVHLVAPDAQIYAYRVSEISGDSHGYLVAEAIMQAIDDGCQVINLSLVMVDLHSAISYAIEYAKENDILVVTAAGNEQVPYPLYPASDANSIAVAGVDTSNFLGDFSRYGNHIDLCAPGLDIYSPYQNTLYAWWSGTSFAAPFVSGEAALVISNAEGVHPWDWLKGALLNTATDLDGLNPDFAGQMGEGLLDPVAALAVTPPTAEAWIVLGADSLVFQADTGSTDTMYSHVFLYSSNSPASYNVSQVGIPAFTSIENPQGVTNDTIRFSVDPMGLLPGVYVDTVEFWVDSTYNCPLYATLTLIILSTPSDSAWVSPDTLFFFASEGQDTTLYGHAWLGSTNGPAWYDAWRDTTSLVFFNLLDTNGYTNDSVGVEVYPGSLSSGIYNSFVDYDVEGIDAVRLYVQLTVDSTIPPPDSCWVIPDTLFFWATEGHDTTLTDYAWLSSTNTPAWYTAFKDTDGVFFNLLDTSGYTNDSVGIEVYPGALPAGVYHSFAIYGVVGAGSTWLNIKLTVDSTTTPPPDSTWLSDYWLAYELDVGSTQPDTGEFWVYYSGDPTPWSAHTIAPEFITMMHDTGLTDNYISFEYSANGLSPGVYFDTVQVRVWEDGEILQNLGCSVMLTVNDTTPPPDYSWLSDTLQYYEVELGSLDTIWGAVGVYSSDAPSLFNAEVCSYDPFVELLVDSGFTNDSVIYQAITTDLPLGMYIDTIRVYVWDECQVRDTLDCHIWLDVVDSTSPPPTAWLIPDTLSLYIEEGDSSPHLIYSFLGSSNAPAGFNAEVDSNAVIPLWLYDTTGFTGDSVGVYVSAGSLTPGWYTSYVGYYVDGVPSTTWLTIQLNVQSATPDSAFFMPDTLFFNALLGQSGLLLQKSLLLSSNQPALWNAWSADSADRFVYMVDTTGYTDDSLGVWVEPSWVGFGTYYNTVWASVAGVTELASLTICLTVTGSDSMGTSLVNFPNPFNPTTTIRFSVGQSTKYSLVIFNVVGQEVSRFEGSADPGESQIIWDASTSSSGVYFYRLTTDTEVVTRKMMLLK